MERCILMVEVIKSCGLNAALVHSFVPDERKAIPLEVWERQVPGLGIRAIRSALYKLESKGFIEIVRPHATAIYLYARKPAAGLPYVRTAHRPIAAPSTGLLPQEHLPYSNNNNYKRERVSTYPSKQQLYNYFEEEGYKGAAECWAEFGKEWRTSKGERIQHWRSFVASVYFTPQNQKKQSDEYGI